MPQMLAGSLFTSVVSAFVFVYPVLMSFVWMGGALWFWERFERDGSNPAYPPTLTSFPRIALVVPCFNEEANVHDTVITLLGQDYPDFEVIAINDGSTDRTGAILDELCALHPQLRVIHQAQNQGKAMGLHMAALCTSAEYLMCIDGDALLAPDACLWMLKHFQSNPQLGAVTGNPRLRTRSTLLGRIQVGEFSSIVGLIKRAQRVYGRMFTVSGVCVMFRRTAIHEVGYWSKDMLCEDIDISWRLQLAGWDLRFEPAATCWILMPETLGGLWKQRLRWSMGGTQAIMRYFPMWLSTRQVRMWPVYLEYVTSLLWSYSMCLMVTLFLWTNLGLPIWPALRVESMVPGWTGVFLAAVCLMQTFLALYLDRRYDRKLLPNFLWAMWYPLIFWTLTTATAVVGLPKTLLRSKGARATWVSPDRGVRP